MATITNLFIWFTITWCQALVCYADIDDEWALLSDILNDYKRDIRPRNKDNEPINVQFQMNILSLVDFDVRIQQLTIVTMTTMKWNDPQLAWKILVYGGKEYNTTFDENEYNKTFDSKENTTIVYNIDDTSVDASHIWTPDVLLFNTADNSKGHMQIYQTKPSIRYDGTVTWTNPTTWKVSCPADITWFPIDRQICTLYFGSRTYTQRKLNLTILKQHSSNSSSDHAFKVENGEWKIDDISFENSYIKVECCHDEFSAIKYTITFHRLSAYYFLYIIIPLGSLAFIFLLVFIIPYDSGERTGFAVTVLLSITVYLLVISEQLPEKSDKTPILGICFMEVFFILCLALILSVITMKLPRRKKMPSDYLLKVLGINSPTLNKLNTTVQPLEESNDNKFYGNECLTSTGSNADKITETWIQISEKLDNTFFLFFFIALLLLPFITVYAIPSEGRA